MGFRPGIVPTLVMLAGVATTASLCVWQLNRNAEKQAIKDEVLQQLESSVLGADELSEDVNDRLYRKIQVMGRWSKPQVLTAGRTPMVAENINLPKVGYGVVQAFEIDNGLTVMVDRGWIPRDQAAEVLAEINREDGRVPLIGQLRPLEGDNTSGTIPERAGLPPIYPPGSWPIIWEQMPSPKVRAVLLEGEPLLLPGDGADPDVYPIGDYKPLPKMRDSLSYAAQWALFGTVLFGVWLALGFTLGRRTPGS